MTSRHPCAQAHLLAGALGRRGSAQLPDSFRVAAREVWAAKLGEEAEAAPGALLVDVSESLLRIGLDNERAGTASDGLLRLDIALKQRDRRGRKVGPFLGFGNFRILGGACDGLLRLDIALKQRDRRGRNLGLFSFGV